VLDAREAPPNQTLLVEFPILVAVGTKPLTRVVVSFVSKANHDPIRLEYPELLYQPIVQFSGLFCE